MSALIRAQQPITRSRAVVELALAGMVWGLGFIATVWSLQVAGPLAITGWRFLIAGAAGAFYSRNFFFSGNALAYFRAAWLPGLLIAATLLFQTWGLSYTTATKSAFLTCLYVLIVPMLEPFFGGRRPSLKLFLCSIGAIGGVALMCGLMDGRELSEKARLNFGDILTVACAVAASLHIIVIGNVHKKLGSQFNGFDFNTAQSFGAGLPTFIVALLVEPGTVRMPITMLKSGLDGTGLPALGFLSLTFGSTLIGFALQVRAQRVLLPSTASLLFLLESPFAALFAYIFLGEIMAPLQMFGGAVILACVAYSSFISIGEAPNVPNQ